MSQYLSTILTNNKILLHSLSILQNKHLTSIEWMITRISLFYLLVMNVLESFLTSGLDTDLDNKESPEEVHSIKDKSHRKQVVILERNHLPVIFGSRPIHVYVGQQAEREHDDPHPYPYPSHKDIDNVVHPFRWINSLQKETSKSHQDITCIMNNQNHRSSHDLIAHRREQDKTDRHRVVEDIFVEFPLCFSFYYHHLKKRKEVDSELNHKVHLQFESRISWPIGVILVNLRTRPATTYHTREPVIITKHCIGHYCDESVEQCIEGKFQN